MAKPPYRGKPAAPAKPDTAEAGAAFIRAYAVTLFDRQDGNGANWPLMAASLFRAAFDVLDQLPDNACRKLAQRVHAGAYERVTEGPKAAAAPSPGASNPQGGPSVSPDLNSSKPGGS